jgi:hypothetical protein
MDEREQTSKMLFAGGGLSLFLGAVFLLAGRQKV